MEKITNQQQKSVNIRTWFTAKPSKGEVNNSPSRTKPDMTFTIKQLLQRFAAGKPLTKSNNLAYTGAQVLPEIKKLDMTDLTELSASARRNIELKRQELKEMEEKKQLRQKEAKEAHEARKKELQEYQNWKKQQSGGE